MTILVTGGAGYIGSHTCVELLNNGYNVIILDNLSNSKFEAVNRIKKITNKDVTFYETDLLDFDETETVFKNETFEAVIHFAGLKSVGESTSKPLEYYQNNVTGTLNLLMLMKKYNVKDLVFSSSATVYGTNNEIPFSETAQTGGITNPYGKTKLVLEMILEDLYASDNSFNITALRYFNPVGAHESGLIGEDPSDIPNNLFPYITQVAVGKLDKLKVLGNDYETIDGTGVRDYIHVVDLAKGHLKALEKINNSGFTVYNLGTGYGISVLEVVDAFEKSTGQKVPFEITERRPGDVGTSYASTGKALKELGFKSEKNISDMCKDSWNWQQKNPRGYEE